MDIWKRYRCVSIAKSESDGWNRKSDIGIVHMETRLKLSLCTKFERNPVGVVRVTAPSVFTSKMAARPPF